jgi:hypothetical protein
MKNKKYECKLNRDGFCKNKECQFFRKNKRKRSCWKKLWFFLIALFKK